MLCVANFEARLRRTSSSWKHKIAGRLGTNLRPKLNCTGMQQTTGELAPREKSCIERERAGEIYLEFDKLDFPQNRYARGGV